jgi:hypothetical protein
MTRFRNSQHDSSLAVLVHLRGVWLSLGLGDVVDLWTERGSEK